MLCILILWMRPGLSICSFLIIPGERFCNATRCLFNIRKTFLIPTFKACYWHYRRLYVSHTPYMPAECWPPIWLPGPSIDILLHVTSEVNPMYRYLALGVVHKGNGSGLSSILPCESIPSQRHQSLFIEVAIVVIKWTIPLILPYIPCMPEIWYFRNQRKNLSRWKADYLLPHLRR